MKYNRLCAFILTLLSVCTVCAGNAGQVSIPGVISGDTVIYWFDNEQDSIRDLSVSGNFHFHSAHSGVGRIIYVDTNDIEYLIYESIPLLCGSNLTDTFSEQSQEASLLMNTSPRCLKIELKGAALSSLEFTVNTPARRLFATREVQEEGRIALMNTKLRERKALWAAGETSVSKMPFEMKRMMFGGKIPDLNGFEYYVGGVFELGEPTNEDRSARTDDPYVKSFDWRSKHGANRKGSYYYNSKNGAGGWITPVKDQRQCGTCSAFAAVGVLEAVASLYYNKNLSLDLSEQQITSCIIKECKGGSNAEDVLNYISSNGIVDEYTFPYTTIDFIIEPCSDKSSEAKEVIKIRGKTLFSPKNELDIKKRVLISPFYASIISMNHAMPLIGYKILKAGDIIYNITKKSTGASTERIVIDEGDDRIGKTAWLFKNSWGGYWGDGGYGYIIVPDIKNNMKSSAYIETPVYSREYGANYHLVDADGDGYYVWGIGDNKPIPPGVPDIQDADDSDPTVGGMDEYGNIKVICKDLEVTKKIMFAAPKLEGNVIIKNGGAITLYNNLTMNADKLLTIERGGTLTIDGTVLRIGSLQIKEGGTLIVRNGGKIILRDFSYLKADMLSNIQLIDKGGIIYETSN